MFQYPNPTDEDLATLSQLAYSVSAHECGACRNYHMGWPYLRLIGANGNGPELCWQLSRQVIMEVVAGRTETRWLIAGAADAGIPALVRSCCRDLPEQMHAMTLIDRCGTPLALTSAYAQSVGISIECVKNDLLSFSRDAGFDVVVSHYTFLSFDEDGRVALLRNAGRWLAPGGRVVLFMSWHDERSDRAASLARKLRWRRERVEDAIARRQIALPEDKDTFLERLEHWHDAAREKRRKSHWAMDDLKNVISRGGFRIDEQVILPENEEEIAVIGAKPPRQVIFVLSM